MIECVLFAMCCCVLVLFVVCWVVRVGRCVLSLCVHVVRGVVCCVLFDVCCRLCVVCCVMRVFSLFACLPLFDECCLLVAACCVMFRCALDVVCCVLFDVNCLLCVV